MRKSSERKKSVPRKSPRKKRSAIGGSAAGESKSDGFQRAAINMFLIFHLIAITCWALPLDILPTRVVKNFVRPYMVWTGLFQSWDTFAPNPIRLNSYAKARGDYGEPPYKSVGLSKNGGAQLHRTVSQREISEVCGGLDPAEECGSVAGCRQSSCTDFR